MKIRAHCCLDCRRVCRLVSAVLFSAALSACSPSLSEAELLARASAAFERGDLAAAELDIKTALQQNPENAEARVLYGRLFVRKVAPDAAVDEFERALAREVQPETLLLLAKALIENGDSAELISDFDAGRYAPIKDDPEFQAALARAYLGQEDAEQAALVLADIAVENNDYVDVSRAVYALIVEGDTDTAESMLDTVTTRSPENAQAWSTRGVVAASRDRLEEAEGFFAQAAKANPYRLVDRLQLASAQIRLGRGDDADADLKELAKLIPRSPQVNFLRGQLLFNKGEYKSASDAFSLVLASNPSHAGALMYSANASALMGNLATAEAQYTEFLTRVPNNVEAKLRLAEVYRRLGDASKTESLARSILGVEAENERALALLAASLSAQGQHAESAQAFEELASLLPDAPAVLVAAGSERVAAGEGATGITQLREAVERLPESDAARERLIEALLTVGELEEASSAASAYAEQNPESARPYVYLGRVSLQQEQQDEAKQQFEKARALEPGNAAASRSLAGLALLAQDTPLAIEYLQEAREANPEDIQTYMSLAVLLEQTGDLDGMVAALGDAIDVDPDAVEPRLALARYGLVQKTPGKSITLLSEIEGENLDDARVQELLARAYMAVDDPGAALLRAERLLSQRPENPASLQLVAFVERANGREDDALEHLETLLTLQPNAHSGRLQLIDLLFGRREFPRVWEEIGKLPDDLQNSSPVLVLRGRLSILDEKFSEAEQLLTQAFEQAPGQKTLVLLAAAKWAQDKRQESIAMLSDWLGEKPDDSAVRGELAARYLQDERNDDAAAEYQKILEAQPDNVVALNNLGWLLRKSDNSAALAYIDKAARLAPNSGEVTDTKAMIVLESGDTDGALALSAKALDALPGNPSIQLNRARILLEVGRMREARVVLQDIIAGPESEAQNEARLLINTI
ncbi:MAG: XrtA/PEP-CTERM system TPR-repeat protein PrsT [Pseudomonadota bacterium]